MVRCQLTNKAHVLHLRLYCLQEELLGLQQTDLFVRYHHSTKIVKHNCILLCICVREISHCRYGQVHCGNRILFCQHMMYVSINCLERVFDKLGQEVHLVFSKAENILKIVAVLCFCQVWQTMLEGDFSGSKAEVFLFILLFYTVKWKFCSTA